MFLMCFHCFKRTEFLTQFVYILVIIVKGGTCLIDYCSEWYKKRILNRSIFKWHFTHTPQQNKKIVYSFDS